MLDDEWAIEHDGRSLDAEWSGGKQVQREARSPVGPGAVARE